MKTKLRVGALAVLSAFGLAVSPLSSGHAVGAPPPNMALRWNSTMLAVFQAAGVSAPAANRLGAIVQAAVFDAVNGIERSYTPIHVQPAAPDDASPGAAAAAAADEALSHLVSGQGTLLDAALAASLDSLADDDAQAVADGLTWGRNVAGQILAWRAGDGFSAIPPDYVFSTAPGQWQPTPGGSGAPRFRTLATTTPFALTSPSQFRPSGPPALTSDGYTRDYNEVKAMGGATDSARTAYQTQTATFWQVDTPVAMWDRVADTLASDRHLNLLRTARLLALVNISIADALIAVFDAKNAFNWWRPVTAIVNADLDGNPNTAADLGWLPMLVTPYFQEYPSAHSGVSSAAAVVLATVFGDDTSFTVTSAGLADAERSFSSFSDAVAQVADARVFAGFHFRFSCDDAAVMGRLTANQVMATLMLRASD